MQPSKHEGAGLEVLHISGPIPVPQRMLEESRGDFEAMTGLTPEAWEQRLMEQVEGRISLQRLSGRGTKGDLG
jgi:hypothetical protein